MRRILIGLGLVLALVFAFGFLVSRGLFGVTLEERAWSSPIFVDYLR